MGYYWEGWRTEVKVRRFRRLWCSQSYPFILQQSAAYCTVTYNKTGLDLSNESTYFRTMLLYLCFTFVSSNGVVLMGCEKYMKWLFSTLKCGINTLSVVYCGILCLCRLVSLMSSSEPYFQVSTKRELCFSTFIHVFVSIYQYLKMHLYIQTCSYMVTLLNKTTSNVA